MLTQLDTLIGFVVVMSVVSLLITIVTQIFSSLFALRGRNLFDALVAMIHKINPSLDQNAKALVDRVLTHPVISDSIVSMASTWCPTFLKRASAIRPQEFLDVLSDIAANAGATIPQAEKDTAKSLLDKLNSPSDATSAAINALTAKLPGLVGEPLASTVAVIKRLEDTANITLANLEKSFGSAQDRAQQWFATHTRILTIIASFIAAFVLQLDSFALIQRISSDPDIRSKLVAGVDALQKQGDRILQDGVATQTIYDEILPELKKTYPSIGTKLDNRKELISNDAVDKWIRSQLEGEQDLEKIVTDYDARAQALAKGRIADLSRQIAPLTTQLGNTGLELLPSPYPAISSGQWSWPFRHLLGIISSAALLSLGAPFWFNTLKSLANLRPTLANEMDKDAKKTSVGNAK